MSHLGHRNYWVQVAQRPAVLAVSAGMLSLNILMLSVLSFSSTNSERRLNMEYNTDLKGSLTRSYRTTLFQYKERQQETKLQALHICFIPDRL